MTKFVFTISHPAELNPKTAGQLVKEALGCTGRVTIRKGEKSGDAKLIFHVLSLSIKPGVEVELSVEGEKEEEEIRQLQEFVNEYLR